MKSMVSVDTKERKPPELRVWIAVSLEIAIAATFISNESVVGLVFCILYLWFSATWAVITDRIEY